MTATHRPNLFVIGAMKSGTSSLHKYLGEHPQIFMSPEKEPGYFVPELNGAVIPAGSLDDEIPIKPQARIFWDSRADWSCDGDTLPRYAEYVE